MPRNDLAWDGESKRIIAVGDGKERSVQPCNCDCLIHYWAELTNETRFGAAFMMDTGSSTGEILGHSKVRPFELEIRVYSELIPLY